MLALWAETTEPPATTGVHVHPFAVSPAELLLEQGFEDLAADCETETVQLLLPSADDGTGLAPVASPQLPAERLTPTQLALWQVDTVQFAPAEALAVLLSIDQRVTGSTRLGAELTFLSDCARLALEYVARGRVVPALERDREVEWAARWRPLLAGDERVNMLARALPTGLLVQRGDNAADARKLVVDLLSTLADAGMRGLGGDQLPAGDDETVHPATAEWVRALGSADPGVYAHERSLPRLRTRLEKWLQPLLASGGLRTCFRITPLDTEHEVEDEEAQTQIVVGAPSSWQVEILLQSPSDRTLLVPAADVWAGRFDPAFFARAKQDPQEKLLTDLVRAGKLYEPLAELLETAVPTEILFTSEQAYEFLGEIAPKLEAAGFGILLPSWWRDAAGKLTLKLKAEGKDEEHSGLGLLGVDSLTNYDWKVSLGKDQELTFEQLQELARMKSPLVSIGGSWVEINHADIQAALDFLDAKSDEPIDLAELLKLAAGTSDDETGLPVEVEADGWLDRFLSETEDQAITPLATPQGLAHKLYHFQERGLSWLYFLGEHGLGACLADDMGLGKTAQTIALLQHERNVAAQSALVGIDVKIGPTLLVAPMSATGNWERELDHWAEDLNYYIHHGSDRLSGDDFAEICEQVDVVITTYALTLRDTDLLASVNWHRIVLDEAQAIKNADTKQRKAIKQIKTPRRVALTGTPVENRLADLWSIMDWLNPGLLGDAGEFSQEFATPIEKYRDEEAAAQLRALTGPFILRRLKTDPQIMPELPEKFEMSVFCHLTAEQASLYQAVVDELLASLEEEDEDELQAEFDGSGGFIDGDGASSAQKKAKRRMSVLAAITKLKQICNHPAYLLDDDETQLSGRSGKLDRLVDMLHTVVADKEKALVFTQYPGKGARLKTYLEDQLGCEVFFLHGGTSKKERDRMVTEFADQDTAPVFLISIKAGGTALNLPAANHVFHFDRWWNPAVENQATDRAWRNGQTKEVQVRRMISMGTIEERIDDLIEAKREIADIAVGASGDSFIASLSTREIRKLIQLDDSYAAVELAA